MQGTDASELRSSLRIYAMPFQAPASPSRVSLQDFAALTRNRLGLIIGPGIGSDPTLLAKLSRELSHQFKTEIGRNYVETCDSVLSIPTNEGEVREFLRTFFAQRPGAQTRGSAALRALTEAKWNAVLSCMLDGAFDTGLRQYAQLHPLRPTVTVVSALPMALPPRTLPIFKLLGALERDDFAYSTVTYATRRAKWHEALRTFADLVKDHPVLCLGMSELPFVLVDLLAEMTADIRLTPASMLFLDSDPVLLDSKVMRILSGRLRLFAVTATLGEIARAAHTVTSVELLQPLLPLKPSSAQLHARLQMLSDVAVLVNAQIESNTSSAERNRLLDSLFAPSSITWEPFAHDLDFQRTSVSEMESSISVLVEQRQISSGALALVGSAASGKTTLLKRLAFNLAKKGETVFWLRPSFYQDTPRLLGELFDLVSQSELYSTHRLFIFMDDPLMFGSLGVNEVAAAATASDINMFLVVGVRTSDWMSREEAVFCGPLPLLEKHELVDELDDVEWTRLPDYLVRLGIDASQQAAHQRVKTVQSRSTRDTLSTLYWLVPATKESIAHSILDEFIRLGDSDDFSRVIVGHVERSSAFLRDAYGMVAVADAYRAPLPVEVLVSALGVGYERWLSSTPSGGAVWGLLYSDEAHSAETIRYRTRNSVVTEVIVRQLNGGSLAYSGELGVLERLLASCTGTQPAYREFAVLILVPFAKLDKLMYEEGLRLFDTALHSLPYEDKTLAHHRALWIRKKGGDPIKAKAALLDALRAKNFPYASRGEADSHIYTSLAATELDAIDRNLVDIEQGKREVLSYLEHSRSDNLLDPKAAHVEARLILRLVARVADDQAPDTLALLGKALNTIDEMLILLETKATDQDGQKDRELLSDVRAQLLIHTGNREAIESRAEVIWQSFRRQEGFEVSARLRFKEASDTQKGRAFRATVEYCQRCIKIIEAAGMIPTPGLMEVFLHTYYKWRINISGSTRQEVGSVDWGLVEKLSGKIMHTIAGRNPLYKYLHALALCHLDSWGLADGVFNDLRRMQHIPMRILWQPRDLLRASDGTPRVVQGEVKKGASGRRFLWVEEIHRDFHVKGEPWPREGETAHAHVTFAFGGSSASPIRQEGTTMID